MNNKMKDNPYTETHFIYMIRASIIGSTIARLSQDRIAKGLGAPDTADMLEYEEEAVAVADLWMESSTETP